MLQSLRQRRIGQWLLCALLAFSLGPGLTLHGLGDLVHADAHNHNIEIFELTSIDNLDGSCDFEHEHDQSHAASVTVACLGAPQTRVDVAFYSQDLVYLHTRQIEPSDPSLQQPTEPPRSFLLT